MTSIKHNYKNYSQRISYKYIQHLVLTLFCTILLTSCQTIPNNIHTEVLNQTHTQKVFITANGLPITTWISDNPKMSNTVRVYIEGDGSAWVRRNRASSDPTPKNRLVHGLMINDTHTDTAYIARPCQYFSNSKCHSDIWTFSRYSNAAVEQMNEVLQIIKTSKNYKNIELVGFSGGATIALILASRRNDITSIRTIAGNLDPAFTNTLHNVSPMPKALNPSESAKNLQHIPQWHFIGASDPIIRPSIFSHYNSMFKNKSCIKSTIIDNANHNRGWISRWPQLLKSTPSCMPE